MALEWGCSSPDKAQERLGITPAYDATTDKLKELAYDSNHNGKPDTWTDMDGARPVQHLYTSLPNVLSAKRTIAAQSASFDTSART